MVLRHNYTRNRDTARAGLRYYQMRPRGEGEPPRSIFASEGSGTRDQAYRMMEEHQAARGFLLHRIVLAPSDEERPGDLREMTRAVMRELEKDLGQRLHWVAIEHRHTDHHHVHVALFGGGEGPGGERREVRLSHEDHARMKVEEARYCAWEREEREEWGRALARASALDRDAGGGSIPPAARDEHPEPDRDLVARDREPYGPEL